MTNEEAIKFLEFQRGHYYDYKGEEYQAYTQQAYTMAIKALEQATCEDYVSRQAVLDKAKYWIAIKETETGIIEKRGYFILDDDVKELPSVTPQQKTGHWVKIGPYPMQTHEYACSKCGHETHDNTENYCSDCGARMEAESEDKE